MPVFKSILIFASCIISSHTVAYAQKAEQSTTNANTKPNILFIVADDLGYQDVGFNGSNWFETPNLDKIAKNSITFQNASMYPTCSPSRAALLTGKHSFRTQVYNVPVLEKKDDADKNIYSRWTVEKKTPILLSAT